MSNTTTLALTSSAGGTVSASVSAGAAASASELTSAPELVSARSLLRSSMENVMAGDFTLYVSDILTIAGITLSAAGILITLYRILRNKDI